MPSGKFLYSVKVILSSVYLGSFPQWAVAGIQTVAISDSQFVSITFPDTSYDYPTPEGCEGVECRCNYSHWRLLKSMTVFETRGDTVRSKGTLPSGEMVVAQQGWLHVDRPGVVVVSDTSQYWLDGRTYRNVLPGDTLFVMRPTCETYFIVWYKDELIDIEAFWSGDDQFGTGSPRGHQILKPKLSWWVKVKSSGINEGWLRIREDGVLDGPDRCCPRFKIR